MSYHNDGRDIGSRSAASEKPPPLDMSHHYSHVAKNRLPNEMKQYYKLFQIPGIGNIAGGLPNVRFFPFDTLEAQTAKPERWTPTPNYPEGADDESTTSWSKSADPQAATRITVPKISNESDYTKKIDLASALQYGQAQGYPPLLSWIRQFTREQLHPNVPYRDGPEVTLVCGSTDGFSKTLDLFVNSWTEGVHDIHDRPGLLCESFVYPSILSQSKPRGVQVAPVKADEYGMVPTGEGSLEDVLEHWDPSKGKRPHLMYTVTLGHNPTGIVLSVERRKELYAVCSKYDVIIVEDEPYWYLQFPSAAVEEAKSRGHQQPDSTVEHGTYGPTVSSEYPFLDSLTPSFLSMDADGRVVRIDTFSKTIAPGCRLGWLTASPAIIEKYIGVSESSTQQPSGFVQAMVAELVMGPQPGATKSAFSLLRTAHDRSTFTGWKMCGWIRWLEGLRGMYERRMNRMCRILDSGSVLLKSSTPVSARDNDWGVITKTPLFDYNWPRGGMFVWIRVLFESHPLWQHPWSSFASSSLSTSSSQTATTATTAAEQQDPNLIGGAALSTALMFYLTHKPHLVLVSTGSIFSANEIIRAEKGWQHFRLCFAAVGEEEVDASTRRFVDGVHAFWRVKDPLVIKKLLEPFTGANANSLSAFSDPDNDMESILCEKLGQIGTAWMGC